MSEYDLIVICGHPRSGTTFVHNVLSKFGKEANIFGTRHLRRNSRFFDIEIPEGLYIDVEIFYDSPFFDTFVPSYMIPYWHTGEPGMFNTFCGTQEHLLELLLEHWRVKLNNPELTVIYKHPQASFKAPYKDYNRKILYIVCSRGRENWSKAMVKDNFSESVDVNAGAPWVKSNWEIEWNTPIDTTDRLYHLHKIWKSANENILNDKTYSSIQFLYEEPDKSIKSIFDHLKMNTSVEDAMNYWKPANSNL